MPFEFNINLLWRFPVENVNLYGTHLEATSNVESVDELP